MNVEFAHDAGAMSHRGAEGNTEFGRDFFAALAGDDKREHLTFPFRERAGGQRRAAGRPLKRARAGTIGAPRAPCSTAGAQAPIREPPPAPSLEPDRPDASSRRRSNPPIPGGGRWTQRQRLPARHAARRTRPLRGVRRRRPETPPESLPVPACFVSILPSRHAVPELRNVSNGARRSSVYPRVSVCT